MPRTRSKKLFPTFSQVGKPDFERLSRLTKLAMGNRSALSFSKDCHLSQPTILRILNMQLKTPLSDEILDAIAKNACVNSEVTLSDLLEANGLVEMKPNESYDEFVVKDMEVNSRPEYALKFERSGIKLIESRIKKADDKYKVVNGCTFGETLQYSFDIEYETKALKKYDIKNWCFEFIYYTNSDDKAALYNKLSRVFALAFLFPQAMKNKAISIVTNAIELYEDIFRDFSSAEITVPISIIFADVIGGKIYKEYQIPMKDKYINIEILK